MIAVRVTNEDPQAFDARVEGVARMDSNAVCSYGGGSSGVGIDGEGDVWVIHMDECGHSLLDDADHFNAVAIEADRSRLTGWIDPQTKEEAQAVVSGLVDTGSHSYTYSDFIGQQLATIVAPQGVYEQVFQGWNGPGVTTEWVYVKATVVNPLSGDALFAAFRVADALWQLSGVAMSAETPLACAGTKCKVSFRRGPRGGSWTSRWCSRLTTRANLP